jgi:cytochrome d ubiquinol oxidase subunit I
LMTTDRAVSPGVSTAEVVTSLSVLTLLYGFLAYVEVRLLLTYIRRGADPVVDTGSDVGDPGEPHDRPLAFAY